MLLGLPRYTHTRTSHRKRHGSRRCTPLATTTTSSYSSSPSSSSLSSSSLSSSSLSSSSLSSSSLSSSSLSSSSLSSSSPSFSFSALSPLSQSLHRRSFHSFALLQQRKAASSTADSNPSSSPSSSSSSNEKEADTLAEVEDDTWKNPDEPVRDSISDDSLSGRVDGGWSDREDEVNGGDERKSGGGGGRGGSGKEQEPTPEGYFSMLGFSADEYRAMLESLRHSTRTNTIVVRAGILLVVCAVVSITLFWDTLKSFFGQQTAEVATLTLEDEAVAIKVEEFAKVLLSQLIDHYSADKETHEKVLGFVSSILLDPTTTKALVGSMNNIYADKKVLEETSRFTNDIVVMALNNPTVNHELLMLLRRVASWPETQQLLGKLVADVIAQKYVQDHVAKLASDVIATDMVQDQVASVVQGVLKNPTVNQHASAAVQNLFTSEAMKEVVGYALYDAFLVSVTPSLFRSRKFPPSTPVPLSTSAEGTSSAGAHTPGLPYDLQAKVAFREAYQNLSAKFGLEFSAQALKAKRSAWETELMQVKARMPPEVAVEFDKLVEDYRVPLFAQEQLLVDAGGEEALVMSARAKLENNLAVCYQYLADMTKEKKGWIFDSYSPEQLADRALVERRVAQIKEEKQDHEYLLATELSAIDYRNPVSHFPTRESLAALSSAPAFHADVASSSFASPSEFRTPSSMDAQGASPSSTSTTSSPSSSSSSSSSQSTTESSPKPSSSSQGSTTDPDDPTGVKYAASRHFH